MTSILLIVIGLAFLVAVSIGVGMSLHTERQRAARRELAGERRRRWEEHHG